MNNLLKNKVALAGVVVVLVAALVGAYFVLGKKSSQPSQLPSEEKAAKPIKAGDIGLTLTSHKPDNYRNNPNAFAIIMKITKLSGISSIEYEVSYDAFSTEEGETQTVPRGVVGSPIQVKSSDTEIVRDIDLGTCSRNVCKYDKVVSDVKFTFKVTYTNGDIGALEQKVSLK